MRNTLQEIDKEKKDRIDRQQKKSINNKQQKNINIYFQKYLSYKILVSLTIPVSYQQIINCLVKNVCVNIRDVILVWNGIQLQKTDVEGMFTFNQNDIIYVYSINNQNKKQQHINVKNKQINNQTKNIKQINDANNNGDIMFQNIDEIDQIQDVVKIQLNQNQDDEFMENRSIKTAAACQDEVRKYNCSFIPNAKSQTFADDFDLNQKKNSKKMLQQLKKNPILKKITTWSFSDDQQPQIYSFKKKTKPRVYISTKSSDGQEIIWESDHSSVDFIDHQLNNRIVMKRKFNDALSAKQKGIKFQEECQMVFSDEDQRGCSQSGNNKVQKKSKILTEADKFLYQKKDHQLQNNKQKQQFIIPPLINQDFLEDQEQFDIGTKIKQQIQIVGNKVSMDLGMSIGKSKGNFIPVVPTFIVDDDDDLQQF